MPPDSGLHVCQNSRQISWAAAPSSIMDNEPLCVILKIEKHPGELRKADHEHGRLSVDEEHYVSDQNDIF